MPNPTPPKPTRPIAPSDLTATPGAPPAANPWRAALGELTPQRDRSQEAAREDLLSRPRPGRLLGALAFLVVLACAVALWFRQARLERQLAAVTAAAGRAPVLDPDARQPLAPPALGRPEAAHAPEVVPLIDPQQILGGLPQLGQGQQPFLPGMGQIHDMIQQNKQRLAKIREQQEMLARRLAPRQPRRAEPRVERPPQQDPVEAEPDPLRQALALRKEGRLHEAEMELRDVIKQHPDLAAAHAELGRILHGEGLRQEAIDCYARALKLDPGLTTTTENLNRAVRGLGPK
jgi:tetratricopeptide (TPR) repeat protein